MNLLIVEDNREMLDFLKSSLKDEGFVVDGAEDGAVGLKKAKSNQYDLIILDIILPIKDGREICLEIRSLGKSVPIIMLSVKGEEVGTRIDLLKIGADDFLTKPFSFEELLARIHALLRRPAKIEPTILKIGDIVLDIDNHSVKRANKEIHLSLKEFALLEYLIRNRGRVLSRAMILEHVWEMDADLFTNTVETHILNLRKKLANKNKKDLIQTVSGLGYKIN